MARAVELVRKKLLKAAELKEITLRQNTEIADSDLLRLQQSFRQKEEIMKALDSLDEELGKLAGVDEIGEQASAELNKLNEQYLEKIKELVQLDEDNRKKMNEQYEQLKQKVRRAKDGKKLHNAYQNSPAGSMMVNKFK